MASIPLVSGGSQPVFATDVLNGSQLSSTAAYTPAGTPTNFMGPKLDFFLVSGVTGIQNQAGVNGAVQTVLQTVQQTSTVAIYQVDTNLLSLAVFPTGAYTAATLQASIVALGANVNGANCANATVTNVGFKLAAA
jgi:hypothetical protein